MNATSAISAYGTPSAHSAIGIVASATARTPPQATIRCPRLTWSARRTPGGAKGRDRNRPGEPHHPGRRR